MKKIFVTAPLLAALAFTGAGAAQATEPPTFEPGTVTESGVVVGDNADQYSNPPVSINTDTPVPSYEQLPPHTKADVEPDAVTVQPVADDVYGSYPAPPPANAVILEPSVPAAPVTDAVTDQPTELAYTGANAALGLVGGILILVGIIIYVTSTRRARSKR